MLERKERSVLSRGSSSQQGQQLQRRSQFSSSMAQMDRLFDEMFMEFRGSSLDNGQMTEKATRLLLQKSKVQA